MKSRLLEENGRERKFVLVLAPGEEAVSSLKEFATAQDIEAASVSGIGAFQKANLGYFNPATKEFRANAIEEQVEVLSMLGNVARGDDDSVKLHLHVVLGCIDATTRGGHLVEGWVSPTLELMIEESPAHLTRAHDEASGLVLLKP